MRRTLAALTVALAACATGATAGSVQADIAPRTVRDDVYPRPAVRFPGGVVGHNTRI